MNRLEKLNECLAIARKFKNPDMEHNLLLAIEAEKKDPCTDIYPDPTDD
jgi:hypothetical protein